jgi:hypothetical protein
MINRNILCYLILPFRVNPLRGRLYSFCGAWQRCNSLEWGALERRTRGPAQRGSGSAGDAATAFHGARIPLRGRTFLRKALLRPCMIEIVLILVEGISKIVGSLGSRTALKTDLGLSLCEDWLPALFANTAEYPRLRACIRKDGRRLCRVGEPVSIVSQPHSGISS